MARRGVGRAVSGLLLFLLSLLVQWWVLSTHRVPPNSDQAIVGLMAKHILEGKGHPVFYYGSTYAGSLEPHYVAAVFAVLGVSPEAYRFAMALLVLLTMGGVFLVTHRAFGGGAALFALAYLSIAPFFFLYKGLTSDGHYNAFNMFAISAVGLSLWIHAKLAKNRRPAALLAVLGFVIGVGWWVNPITAAISASVLGWLYARRRPRPSPFTVVPLLGGAVAGSFPWWFWNLRHGWASLKAPEMGLVGPARALGNLLGLAWTTLPTLAGGMQSTPNIHYSREIFPLSRELAIGLLLLLLGCMVVAVARGDRKQSLFLLAIVSLVVAAAFSQRLVLSEPRFLFPYYVLVPPLAGAALANAFRKRRFVLLGVAAGFGALLLNVWSLAAAPVNLTLSDKEVTGSLAPLSRELERLSIDRVYTGYWTAYRLSFESGERVIATPIPLDEYVRYGPYAEEVNASRNAAVVLFEPRSGCFENFLKENDFPFRSSRVTGYSVFWGLSAEALEPIRSGKGLPLPEEAYQVSWKLDPQPERLTAGDIRPVRATVRNDSPCLWPNSVHLSYHWWPAEPGFPAIYDGARGYLPGVLDPGESASLTVNLIAPPSPGRYRLEYDLVHENVAWFSTKGGRTVSVEMDVLVP